MTMAGDATVAVKKKYRKWRGREVREVDTQSKALT